MPRIQTDDASACEPSPLLRALEVLRVPLLPLLAPRDLVTLLATCRTLQHDDEIVTLAFAGSEATRHFFTGCYRDWCALSPSITYFNSFECNGEHDNSDDSDDEEEGEEEEEEEDAEEDEEKGEDVEEGEESAGDDDDDGNGEEGDQEEEENEEEEVEEWNAEALTPARRLSMLSLALLMQTELTSVIYKHDGACVHTYYTLPFILPLSRMKELTQESPTLPSQLSCHTQNFTASLKDATDHTVVTCGFCDAVDDFKKASEDYKTRRDKEEAAIQQQLEQEGHCGGSEGYTDEYWARMEAFEASKKELDERYDREERAGLSEAFASYCGDERTPQLKLTNDGGEHDGLWDVLWEASHDEFTDRDSGFCQRKLQPLVSFFQLHGFGSVVCTELDSEAYDAGELGDELREVLMIGAAAPQGFFAGVYFLVQYT